MQRVGPFVPEKASADVEPSQYKGDEIVTTMKQYEEELIAVARKMKPRYVRF